MKNKLEVGMYVRTKFGIGSYIKDYTNSQGLTWRVLEGCYNLDNQEDFATLFCDCEIIKASHNIIDLIEIGDYVNGFRVYEVKASCVMVGYKCFATKFDDEQEFLYQTIFDDDIKSIVTKEQFESMSYKVGD